MHYISAIVCGVYSYVFGLCSTEMVQHITGLRDGVVLISSISVSVCSHFSVCIFLSMHYFTIYVWMFTSPRNKVHMWGER